MNVWDKLSVKYDTLWVQKYSLIPTRKKIISFINKNNQDFTLLDIGCATGQLLCEIKENFPHSKLLGIDKSISMISLAKAKRNDIEFECISVEDLTLDAKFDFITCCHSLPYYSDKEQALYKISKLLKDDGKAIFIHASINSFYDKFVMSIIEKTAEKAEYLSKNDFCVLAQKNFEIIDTLKIKEKWFMPSIYGFILGKKI